MFPKRDYAVVLPIIDDATNDDYILGIEKYVSTNKIVSASRMSNGRFCIYFDSRETADSLVSKHEEITVKDKTVKVRPLISPSKKLLISNVSPCIPHSVIENVLTTTLGLKLTSAVAFVKASFTITRFQHINSFRRSVYYTTDKPENENNTYIPDSLIIKYEDEDYRIFLTTETNMKCFLCQNTGHLQRNCPNANVSNPPPTDNLQNKREAPSTNPDSLQDESTTESQTEVESSENDDVTESKLCSRNKNKQKKIKLTKSENDQEHSFDNKDMEKIKKRLQIVRNTGTVNIPLTDEKFLELIVKVQSSNDKIGETLKYTEDLTNLIATIEEIKPEVNRYSKSSLTSYLKRLRKKHEKLENHEQLMD